jgi:O-antigen polymerase
MLAAILIFGILTLWVPGRWALSAFQVAICALAIARIFQSSGQRRSLNAHPVGVLLAAIALWGVLQAAAGWSVQALNTQQAVLDGVINLAAFSLAVEEACDARRRERFLRVFLWFAAGLAVLAIFTALTSRPGYAFWVFPLEQDVLTLGPFVYHNQYAAFVEAILPLAILRAILDRGRAIGYAAIAVLLFASVVVGGSRTGTLLCLAEILLIPAFAYTKRLIPAAAFLRVLAGSLATIALAVAIAGWQTIWMRLQEPNPYAVRANLVRSSIAMFRDRPWTGFGLGTWSVAYPHYALYDDGQFVNQAHNDWIQWAVEGGLPLFAIILSIAIWILRPAARVIWGLGIVAGFLHCLIDYPFQQRPALAAFFFAWLGVVAAAGDGITPSTRAIHRAAGNTNPRAPVVPVA